MKMDSLLLEKSSFHNPRLNISDETKRQKIQEVLKDLYMPVSKLKIIMDQFTEEMKLGLQANPSRKSVFYMCNTFVTDFPDGTEEGDVLAIDLGGSNLRIMLARMKPGQETQFRVEPYEIDVQYRQGKPENLFNFLAVCIEDFLNKNSDIEKKRLPLGFTFSFGFDQLALDKATILEFSIQTNLPEAIGNDAVQYLREAIVRKGLDVDVLAIANDTTSTLVYGMGLQSNAEIGFLLGSGTNTCYMERVDRIEKIDSMKTFGRKVDNVIINLENGFLGDNGSLDSIKSKWDKEIDEESLFPHSVSYEKLLGGVFIGEVIRRALLALAQSKVFVSGIVTDQLKTKDSIKGPDLSGVESDKNEQAATNLLNKLGYSSAQITSDDIEVVKYVCALVSVRNALISAANISAVVLHINKPFVRVAMDGSLYKYHPKLHTLIPDFIRELVPKENKVELFLAADGSGKGSAYIAAVAAKQRQKS